MKFKTITIGGGNKNYFLCSVSLEFVIVQILKSKNISKHIHIGNIPRLRLLFLHILFFFNRIPFNKFIYKGQLSDLNYLKKNKNLIVISSAPLVGSITTIESWKIKLPVLIYDPGIFYINCSSFLKDEKLVWKNIKELKFKLENVINNYEYYSDTYYKHYKFLRKQAKENNWFLVENARKIYDLNLKNVYYKRFIILRVIAILFKPVYLIGKAYILFITVYLLPIINRKKNR